MNPTAEDFRRELHRQLAHAQASGADYVKINAGELHRDVGGYPGIDHRMPVCCEVMTSTMEDGDKIIDQPPKGKGARLTIRYRLPREGDL